MDPNTGVVSVVGHPAGVARITGLAFALNGFLYGTKQVGGGFPPPPGPVCTLVGSTGRNFVGDLAFAPVPETGTLAPAFLATMGIALRRRIRTARSEGAGVAVGSPLAAKRGSDLR